MSEEMLYALKRVVRGWGVFEILMVVIFFPLSLLYILVRFIQEYKSYDTPEEDDSEEDDLNDGF